MSSVPPIASKPATTVAPTAVPPATKPPALRPVAVARLDPQTVLRRSVYAILITLSVGAMTGRILAINSVDLVRVEARLKAEAIEKKKQELETIGQLAGKTDRDLEELTRGDWQRQRP